MKKIYVLLYGGDTGRKGTRLGLETLSRIDELLRLIINRPYCQFEILLAAGSHPAHEQYPQLKEVMAERLGERFSTMRSAGVIQEIPTITLVEPDVWNTSNESLAAALFLESIGTKELYVVSSKTHRKRIEYIWSLIGGFTLHFVGAPTRNYWRSVIYEWLAMLKVYCKDRKLLQQRKFSTSQAAKTWAINY